MALIIVSAKADLSFPNVSIGNPVMCYSEHRFRLKACRNDIVLAETMTKAKKIQDHGQIQPAFMGPDVRNIRNIHSVWIFNINLEWLKNCYNAVDGTFYEAINL